ncbi:MAG: hypothetical protein MJ175_08810, partial [Clostridia bacterium]|nr:hypothetical protein [Clostridia bacterium]
VFASIRQCRTENGSFDPGYLGEAFSGDEIGRITGMQVTRSKLNKNDIEILRENLGILREEKTEAAVSQNGTSMESIEDLIRKKRGK